MTSSAVCIAVDRDCSVREIASSSRRVVRAQHASRWSERELVEHMIARREGAWEEFLRRYDRMVRGMTASLLRRFSANLSSSDADEVRSQFLLSLLARDMVKLRRFDPDRGVRLTTWVGLMVTNAAWDYLRSRRSSARLLERLSSEPVKPGRDALGFLLTQEELRRFEQAFGKLAEQHRHFLELLCLEGAAPRDIASQFRIDVKTVYTRKHKLIARMQSQL